MSREIYVDKLCDEIEQEAFVRVKGGVFTEHEQMNLLQKLQE